MQDQPSILELVRALRGFVEDEAAPQLKGRAAFHARVAVNVLGIIERGLERGPEQDAAEQRRLETLLGRSGSLDELNRELCRRIRGGQIDLDTPALREHLRETTLAKLAVDQPGYAAYRRAIGADAE